MSTDYIAPADHHSNQQLNRFSPQKVLDQTATHAVGGTVTNTNIADCNALDDPHTDQEEITTVEE